MKFAWSSLSAAIFATLLMGLSAPAFAVVENKVTNKDNKSNSNEVKTSQITRVNKSAVTEISRHEKKEEKNTPALSTITDPVTHKNIDNSYPLEVSSFLSLEEAQNILLQVSPKLAANQAAIAASDYQTDALKTVDNPFVFAQVSASAYTLQEDIDLSKHK